MVIIDEFLTTSLLKAVSRNLSNLKILEWTNLISLLETFTKTLATAQSVKKYRHYLEIYLSFGGTRITLHKKEASFIDFISKGL